MNVTLPQQPIAPLTQPHPLSSANHTESPTEEASEPDEFIPSAKDVDAVPGPPYRCPHPSCKDKPKQYTLLSSFR